MPAALEPLLHGLSVYQDIVLAGETVRRGERDCQARWRLLAPWLTEVRTLLDIGSNFGWFCWQVCRQNAAAVVASVEPDERSAAVQRLVLASNNERRIALLTQRAGLPLLTRWERAGQRFDAALCLSVLHWLPDHRQTLAALDRLAGRIFIELPHPQEPGAGRADVRCHMTDAAAYLAAALPRRSLVLLGSVPSHLQPELSRDLWMADRPAGWPASDAAADGLDAEALLDLSLSWPPRDWWQRETERLQQQAAAESLPHPDKLPYAADRAVRFTSAGLACPGGAPSSGRLIRLRRLLRRAPQDRLLSSPDWLRRRLRRLGRWFLQ